MNQTPHPYRCYRWHGKNLSGQSITDTIFAKNRYEVISILAQKQIKIRCIKQVKTPFLSLRNQRMTGADINLFTRQLTTMLNAGLSLVSSLELIERNHPKLSGQLTITTIKHAIEEGDSLSEALKKATPLFDDTYINLISNAELSGQLAETFERISKYRENAEQQRSKIAKAMIYPIFVLILALSITYLMLVSVIPEFENMFHNFDAQLPWFTQKIIFLSHWLSNNSVKLLLSIVAILGLYRALTFHSHRFHLFIDKKVLQLPVIGPLLAKSVTAKFNRSLAVTVRSGIPIISAIRNSINLTSNLYYKAAIQHLFHEVSTGVPIYIAMKTSDCFPNLMVQMIMVGEQSGTLEHMLDKVADTLDSELDASIEKLNTLIEPLLILFLGLVVGSLVVAIYLPIFNMMNILG
ncbi:type II secretion system F family protein [Vibrio algarum]|uniref:Type II secretion system F family protein n=1 Tax=Vibrio algarum TaxID=3020714 RepID=A0ABT4YNB3_9VIBR|nr:type II secretion system F family protein [Vibrio sp. KJ40-1]MDB1123031.1 type II secretion system F family protein [Vibrio sp. KJ40-1]